MIKINDRIIELVQDGIQWAGAKDTVARTLDFSIVYQPLDKTLPNYQAAVGDKVAYIQNNKTFFYGYIENLKYNTDDNLLNIHCCDLMQRLLNSKCIGRFKGTLNQLADNICGIFSLKNGIESDSTHIHNIISTGDLSYYDVLNTACDVMFERYCPYLDGTTLKIAEHTIQDTFEIRKNIRASSFEQNMKEIVNKVLIIDNKGNLINTVEDKESINKYGLFQEVFKYDKDSKNNLADAQKIIQSVQNEAIITVENNNECIAGRYIRVYEPVNNFKGIFEITSDSHNICANSNMTLEIEFVGVDNESNG